MQKQANDSCIINIENKQDAYASCLEFIKLCDKYASLSKEERHTLESLIKKIRPQLAIDTGKMAPRYLEQPIERIENAAVEDNPHTKSVFNKKEFTQECLKNGIMHYHIRVRIKRDARNLQVNQSEFIHLQYLALMLMQLNELGLITGSYRERVTVFCVPVTGNNYPFQNEEQEIDYDSYMLVSHYLRLMAKKYNGVIYGVTEEQGKTVVASLDFRKGKKYETYFPVTPIDAEIYNTLFIQDFSRNSYEELFSITERKRFRKSNSENPKEALADFDAETAIKHIYSVLENCQISELDVNKGKKIILEIILKEQGGPLMHFCLFSFLLCIEGVNSIGQFSEVVRSTWYLASDVFQGIRQLVQNSIQHSQMHSCVFSFYLHSSREYGDENQFISNISLNYPNTEFKAKNNIGHYEALEIFVSDLNERETILENFERNLGEEIRIFGKNTASMEQLKGHKLLLKNINNICIRNFFSDFEDDDCVEAWSVFRQQDLVAHVGLSLMALTAKRCKASVKLLNSKDGKLSNSSCYFYHSYSSKGKTLFSSNDRIVPGTQVSLLIPINEWEDRGSTGLGKIQHKNQVSEDYESFAAFIDYQEKREPVTVKAVTGNNPTSGKYIANARTKNILVNQWKEDFWLPRFKKDILGLESEKKIFNHDFDAANRSLYFKSADYIEVCLKGLIGAVSVLHDIQKPFYVALTNLPAGFIEQFCKISILMGVRKLPHYFQLCLCEKDIDNMIVFAGDDFEEAIYNSYILSLEHGIRGFTRDDCSMAQNLKDILMQKDDKIVAPSKTAIAIFPFDAVLKNSKDEQRTIFEERIRKKAENSLEHEPIGYKLNQTHMRLGSKVHIESFYEMSFLFYRTTIANRIAFIILQRLKSGDGLEKKIDIIVDNLIFYGYASYSKAILSSITEILRIYRNDCNTHNNNVAFISYEHNVQSESEKVQMHFGLPKNFPGVVDNENKLRVSETTFIIQIVPISSTLTTFDKMWLKLKEHILPCDMNTVRLCANYTVFWVIDSIGNIGEGLPSDIEKKYWKEIEKEKEPKDDENNKIKLSRNVVSKFQALEDAGNKTISFFMKSPAKWHDPLKCSLCYPEKVIEEIPLVETDVTSTVPSQQIRFRKKNMNDKVLPGTIEGDNNARLLKLKDCVYSGHICRRQNHYQYYIDTQRYFYEVKEEVMEWLENIAKKNEINSQIPTLNIIFSPEHNTNVGFAQYVNTYYFNGIAEIVSFNVDKQFRSNFICEHAALIKTIEDLHEDPNNGESLPVRFFFVDDTIITGETFEKANSFLHSLIPNEYREKYPSNLFKKIFLLFDRLSNETKNVYVRNISEDFLSFVHIDLSNIRTQGDSCIGCKLEQNAEKLFKRSATVHEAAYWANKLISYEKVLFDDKDRRERLKKEEAFQRLLVSHTLQNILIKNGNVFEEGNVYQAILNISLWMMLPKREWKAQKGLSKIEKELYGYEELLQNLKGIKGIKTLLKIVCRPFFMFDFKIRKQVLTLFVFWTELLLGSKCEDIISDRENSSKNFLYEKNRIDLTKDIIIRIANALQDSNESESDFIRDYLLEGLSDMGSTYLIRKQTMIKIYQYVAASISSDKKQEFWETYVAYIQRILINSSDETKELWLEYLYLNGYEYNDFQKNYDNNEKKEFVPVFLYETISGKKEVTNDDKYFYQFCHELFLHNNGINFDGLEKNELQSKSGHKQMQDEYFMEYWKQIRSLDKFQTNASNDNKQIISSEMELFKITNTKQDDYQQSIESADKWYENFLEIIARLIHEKYNVKEKNINIAIITKNIDRNESEEGIQKLNIVKKKPDSIGRKESDVRYGIKNRIVKALEENDGLPFELEANGYTIRDYKGKEENESVYLIILFDNPEVQLRNKNKRNMKKIDSVFLYISIETIGIEKKQRKKLNFNLKMILRDILTYRNRILKFLESDFSGEIFSQYAHTVGEKNILSHEKANSHNTTADDEISIEMFIKKDIMKAYKVLDENHAMKWLLLRNYTNGQIAKMFNRSFQTTLWENSDRRDFEITPLYVAEENSDGVKVLFGQRLDKFSKLGIEVNEQIDGRFALLREVVDIKCINLSDAKFISNEKNEYYNLEYFKCILIDICISAIKFQSCYPDYLLRVDGFLDIKKRLENQKNAEKPIREFREGSEPSLCTVKMYREKSNNEGIDFLVIRNSVDKFAHKLNNWKERNQTIMKRLSDPLDYIDGHMSLLTIKRYIENMDKSNGINCSFQYDMANRDYGEHEELYFETKLPVLKGDSK